MSDVAGLISIVGAVLVTAALSIGFMKMKEHAQRMAALEAQDLTHAKKIDELAAQLATLTAPHTRVARARQDTAEEAQFAIGSILTEWEVLQRKLAFITTLTEDVQLIGEKMSRAQERIANAGRGENNGHSKTRKH